MTTVTKDPGKPTLYVCNVERFPKQHPCQRADTALTEAGVGHEKVVYGKGRPFGLGTRGTRPDLAEVSGQEKLPVLVLPGGETICGGSAIVEWARAQT